ncbi:MAG TPA: hypothetical protein V6C96_02000 [Vampirovibrionales bacterium]
MSDVSKIIQRFEKKIQKGRERLAKGIVNDIRGMLEKRVPVDTRELQEEGLSVEYRVENNQIIIDAFVNSLQLTYSGRTQVRADALGLILDIGFANGRELRRTRSQPRNPARTPTQGWFSEDFVQDVKEYLSSEEWRKYFISS